MIDEHLSDANRRMDKSVEATLHEFNTVRTGRASAALLDRIQIDYYGQPTPLKQLATINVPEPRLLTVQPFDPTSIKAIERALQESDLGLALSARLEDIESRVGELERSAVSRLRQAVRRSGRP